MLEFLLPPGLIDAEPPYWFATIRGAELPRQHYDGVPRPAVNLEAEPRILVLEPGGAADVFVSHYAADLGYLTDTWYATREAALEDLAAIHGTDLDTWRPVPESESHPETYILRLAASGQAG